MKEKALKNMYDKTHRSDRGGDGILWSEYNNKLNPHIIIIKKPENNIETEIGRRETQPRKKTTLLERRIRGPN